MYHSVVKFSRNGVPPLVSGVPPPVIAIPPPKIVVPRYDTIAEFNVDSKAEY